MNKIITIKMLNDKYDKNYKVWSKGDVYKISETTNSFYTLPIPTEDMKYFYGIDKGELNKEFIIMEESEEE